MASLLKSKKGLSTVVTTLIILVVSVLLASVVTLYAINVTTTRVEEESLFLTKQHVWYNATGSWAEAGLIIINTGGRDVVIDKISVRGQEATWTNVYTWTTNTVTITDDLNATRPSGSSYNITIEGSARTFTRASSDLTLKSGYTMVIYINDPDSISVNDVGLTVGITVHSASAQYYKEANVEPT